MSKLMLDPAQESFGGKLAPETIAAQLDGGKSRLRRIQLGAATVIQVNWYLEGWQYDYLMAFYRASTAHGSLPFTLDIILESSVLVEHTAQFVPGSIEIAGVRGTAYVVAAQLEIQPLNESTDADLALIAAYEASLDPDIEL